MANVNVLSAPKVNASLILKHGTAAQWTSTNPILIKGELGLEIDTGLMKVGDGVSNYADLQYINLPASQYTALNQKIDGVLTNAMTKPETFVEGNLPVFDEEGNLVDSGTSIGEYISGPTASETIPGTVLSSDDDNSIKVDEEGKMSLNRVSTSNLFIPDEEELVLFAGDSTI